MNIYNDDYVKHYGVLGMKWGIHRAKKNTSKASNLRTSAKKYDSMAKEARLQGNSKKASRYSNRASKNRSIAKKKDAKYRAIMNKHRRLAGKETLSRISKKSTLSLYLESTLVGTYGALKYEQARAKGNSRGKSILNALMNDAGNMVSGGTLQFIEPRLNASPKKKKK